MEIQREPFLTPEYKASLKKAFEEGYYGHDIKKAVKLASKEGANIEVNDNKVKVTQGNKSVEVDLNAIPKSSGKFNVQKDILRERPDFQKIDYLVAIIVLKQEKAEEQEKVLKGELTQLQEDLQTIHDSTKPQKRELRERVLESGLKQRYWAQSKGNPEINKACSVLHNEVFQTLRGEMKPNFEQADELLTKVRSFIQENKRYL